jgi:uncharacterized protein YqjF (DUF2071 family)
VQVVEPSLDRRIAASRRPSGHSIGAQRWRSLLFLHWPMPADVVQSMLPEGLTVDLFDGVAYFGLVPFAMRRVRWLRTPEELGFRFLETNVRTYVHLGGHTPAVYFFSLDAASPLAVIAARTAWGLPYHWARMSMTRHNGRVRYLVRRLTRDRPRLAVSYSIGEPIGAARPGTLDYFLIERYLFVAKRLARTVVGQVHHRPYPLRSAVVEDLRDELVAATGISEPLDVPAIVHFSPGVDVEIFAPRRL